MNLIVFAGTFNPIHTGHLIIAEHIREYMDCSKILFIPSYNPPHKNNLLVEAEHRLNMVKLATYDNPYFEVCDIEFQMKGISYTINTIRKLYEENPDINDKINFIIGADAYLEIDSWYQSDELKKILNFVVLARPNSPKINDIVIKTPVIDISSSNIRLRVKNDKSIRYLVSERVREYIYEQKLYT